MTAVAAAFSLSEQMKTLGAYAGFAAILGLAVLSMLYFAQARELKRLREWAGRSPEIAAELEQRAQAEAAQRPVPRPPAPRPQSAPAQAKQAAATVARVAAAPVGAAASTAVAAARKAGIAAPETETGKPGTAAGQEAAVPPPAPSAQQGVVAPAKDAPGAAPAKDAHTTGTARPPAPGPGGGPGKPQAAGTPPLAAQKLAKPAAAAPLRAGAPSAVVPPRTAAAGGAPAPGPPAATGRKTGPGTIAAGVVGVILVIFGATRLFGGDDSNNAGVVGVSPQIGTTTATSPTPSPQPPLVRKGITVAVLNGTTTNGLARGAANRVQTAGYKIGQVTNATDNTLSATTVGYVAGYRRAGLDVARILHVPAVTIKVVDSAARVVAGEDAMVIVTVGSDQRP
jgi:hypothetical protein